MRANRPERHSVLSASPRAIPPAADVVETRAGSRHPVFFFSSRGRHTRFGCDWSSDVCSADLMGGGDKKDLIRMRAQLEKMLAEINRQLEKTADGTSAESSPRRVRERGRTRPVRALVLDCLEDLAWPAYTREISLYSRARFGREIAPARFGS